MLADYGITKEMLDRLALLKLKVEPPSPYVSVAQWSVIMSGFELVNTFSTFAENYLILELSSD